MTTEWLILSLLVASATLSAASFYQATSFSESATDALNQSRFAAATQADTESALEAQITHDRNVLRTCGLAIQQRDEALRAYSRAFEPAASQEMVDAEQTRIAIQALLIADSVGFCPGYSVDTAVQFALAGQDRSGSGDPEQLAQTGRQLNVAETRAVQAAVLFAAVLLLLTLADLAASSFWTGTWLGAGVGMAAGGVLFAGIGFVTAGESPLPLLGMAAAVALVVLIAAFGTGPWWAAVAGLEITRSAWGRMPSYARRSTRWWAEALGAGSLVIFAVAALGYAISAGLERDAVAAADDLTLEARQTRELSQRASLAVLATAAELAELDAGVAGSTQSASQSGDPSVAPYDAPRSYLLEHMWLEEQAAWASLLASQRAGASGNALAGSCLADDVVLPWVTETYRDRSATLPDELLDSHREDIDTFSAFISRSNLGSTLCSTAAGVAWDAARGWGSRAALFTVSLVVLGLAGFVFGLATSEGRGRHPQRWLLASGLLGLAVGASVNFAAWMGSPDVPTDQELARGARAVADSTTAQLIGDCSDARSQASVAIADLPSYGAAHVVRANAAACTESASWLIAPAMAEGERATFTEALQRARELGTTDSVATGNLGWGRLLDGLMAGTDGPSSWQAIEEGVRLSAEALQVDPSNPYFCLNHALGTLALGDVEQAELLYRDALADLDRNPTSAGSCGLVRFDIPYLRTIIRLSALADLELVEQEPAVDRIRNLIVGGDPAPATKTSDEDAVELVFYPQEVGVYTTEGSPLVGQDVSIVWYYRGAARDPWAVLTRPSASTFDPGQHLDVLFALQRPTPTGEFRADVYVDGRLSTRVTSLDQDWWAEYDLDGTAFRWVQAPDLGISVVIPREWDLIDARRGAYVVYGSATGHAIFQREDATPSDGMVDRAQTWSERLVAEWGLAAPEIDLTEFTPNDYWYFGMDESVVGYAEGPPSTWLGVGHTQYLVSGGSDLPLDVEDASCPGTTLMTLISADDDAIAETMYWSLVFEADPMETLVEDIGLTSPFVSPTLSVAYPDDWIGAGCPDRFTATAPTQEANVIISARPTSSATLAEEVDAALAAFESDESEFTGFELLDRSRIELAAGVDGEAIEFTWTSDGVSVTQQQVYAVVDETLFLLTFTTHAGEEDVHADAWEQIVDEFRIRTVDSLVPAVCEGCSGEESAQRQEWIDEIAFSLRAVDARNCQDTTNAFEVASALARLGCSFAGGFEADFALWPDAAALDAFTADFQAIEGGVLMEWRLFADDVDPTGITVEWVDEEGNARFFWTWDELRMSGNAVLTGGDQDRLNAWWETTGALLQELTR